jgi:SecD/SecF fusion protein
MTKQGQHDWEVMTAKNLGLPIAITIDNHVLSCPVVTGVISGGETEISGNFSVAEAEELAARINKGK